MRGRRPRPTSAAELVSDALADIDPGTGPEPAALRTLPVPAAPRPRPARRPRPPAAGPTPSAPAPPPATALALALAPVVEAPAAASPAPAAVALRRPRPGSRRARALAAACAVAAVAATGALLVTGRGPAPGPDLVTVLPRSGGPGSLTMADAAALADPTVVPDASSVAPLVERSEPVVAGEHRVTATLTGSTPGWLPTVHRQVAQGRSFSAAEVTSGARVVVLGSLAAQALFPSGGALGHTVEVRATALTVVGVLRAPAAQATADELALVPITTAQGLVGGAGAVDSILVAAPSADAVFTAYQEVNTLLLQTHHNSNPFASDFTVTTAADTNGGVGLLRWALGAVVAAGLLGCAVTVWWMRREA
ncbi:MAG TPA: ABC transporter permease [Candidatus Dormibacteraeota bacterium]